MKNSVGSWGLYVCVRTSKTLLNIIISINIYVSKHILNYLHSTPNTCASVGQSSCTSLTQLHLQETPFLGRISITILRDYQILILQWFFFLNFETRSGRRRIKNGVFLFLGGPEEENKRKQTGGRNVFPVWLWCKNRRHEDFDEVLSYTNLLQILESHHLLLLRLCS